ncbi:MAG TPA: cytochrome c [Xanthomonadaceae bacterium]
MKTSKKTYLAAGVLIGSGLIAGTAVMYAGIYNVAADDPHTRPVYALLETARERSIAVRAARLQVPADLNDPARIRQGAGNYNAMCTGCHLAPGMAPTEMSKGLYPAPPDLTRERVSAAEAFWVIKHGIKASGMPAWGKSMGDDYIWNMAAFLQALPKLDKAQYTVLVASSGGHSHGGGETEPHGHGDGETDDQGGVVPSNSASHPHPPGTPPHDDTPGSGSHAGMDMGSGQAAENKPHAHGPNTPADHHAPKPSDKATSAKTAAKPAAATVEHRHADGTVESHPAPAPAPNPPSNDGHDDHHH